MIYTLSGTQKRRRISARRVITSVKNRILRIVGQLRQHARNRRDYEHLQRLPDYILADVGLSREQINHAMNRQAGLLD